jgi:hypothetical protein
VCLIQTASLCQHVHFCQPLPAGLSQNYYVASFQHFNFAWCLADNKTGYFIDFFSSNQLFFTIKTLFCWWKAWSAIIQISFSRIPYLLCTVFFLPIILYYITLYYFIFTLLLLLLLYIKIYCIAFIYYIALYCIYIYICIYI